jgi:hypothetical protein
VLTHNDIKLENIWIECEPEDMDMPEPLGAKVRPGWQSEEEICLSSA